MSSGLPESGQGIGGQAIVDLRTGAKDLRLYRRAILNGWNVPPEIKLMVVLESTRLAKASRDERVKLGAMKLLLQADSIDARIQIAAEGGLTPPPAAVNVNVGVGVQVRPEISAATDDRLLALEQKLDRAIDQRQRVESPAANGVAGASANGTGGAGTAPGK